MLYFHNDYNQGCHGQILEKLTQINQQQLDGYGMDPYCARAADRIRALCKCPDAAVHFLVGGTQVNLTVIAGTLRPYQAVIGAESAHIHVHETAAVEATGHKILTLPSRDGKLTARQIGEAIRAHRQSPTAEHEAQPKMVYLSNPTELGTIYTLRELEDISAVCRSWGMYLFVDGARLGYGLTARGNDVTLADLARLTDVFYIGGTKVGALFGEAVVIPNPRLREDFRYLMKQRGGMLAKGWLLGVQFWALFEDDLYFRIAGKANSQADRIRAVLAGANVPLLIPGVTNQIFPIFPDSVLEELGRYVTFTEQKRIDESNRAIRLCTSWATTDENVDELCRILKEMVGK